MNNETKIRTIVAMIVAINQALITFDINIFAGITEDTIYQTVSVIAMVVAWGFSHYKNNDFSPEACKGTGLTRLLKAAAKGVNGENFVDQVEEVEEVEGDA